MSSAKDQIESLMATLPDDCTLEDIQYHLYVIQKIRHGAELAETQGTLTQEEVQSLLHKWTTR